MVDAPALPDMHYSRNEIRGFSPAIPVLASETKRRGIIGFAATLGDSFKNGAARRKPVLKKRNFTAPAGLRTLYEPRSFNLAPLDLTHNRHTLLMHRESPDVSENQVRAAPNNISVHTPTSVRWYGLDSDSRGIGQATGGVVWRNAWQLFPGGGFSGRCIPGFPFYPTDYTEKK
jgi:hypothetical protein